MVDLNNLKSTTPHYSNKAILDVKSVTPFSKTPFHGLLLFKTKDWIQLSTC